MEKEREADEKSELLRTTEEEILAEVGNQFVEKREKQMKRANS
jgi:hypothetical protein